MVVVELLGLLVAAVLGAAAGAVLTATHRQLPPWGLLLGLLIAALLVVGYRLAFGSRRHAAAAAVGLVAAAVVLAMPGPGGSVLVTDDALGYGWTFGLPLVAAVAIAWPGRRSGRPAPATAPDDASDAELP